ncbi:hypothetical protein UT300012_24260 [Paraclostridium bifermentans]
MERMNFVDGLDTREVNNKGQRVGPKITFSEFGMRVGTDSIYWWSNQEGLCKFTTSGGRHVKCLTNKETRADIVLAENEGLPVECCRYSKLYKTNLKNLLDFARDLKCIDLLEFDTPKLSEDNYSEFFVETPREHKYLNVYCENIYRHEFLVEPSSIDFRYLEGAKRTYSDDSVEYTLDSGAKVKFKGIDCVLELIKEYGDKFWVSELNTDIINCLEFIVEDLNKLFYGGLHTIHNKLIELK